MRLGERRLVNAGLVRADCTQCVKIGENARAIDARETVNHGFSTCDSVVLRGRTKFLMFFAKAEQSSVIVASRVDFPADNNASAMIASHATMTSAVTAPAVILAFSFSV